LTNPGCRLFESPGDLYEASFVERPNRFVVRGDLAGRIVEAHCPNPGRLREILLPGTTLLLQKRPEHPGPRKNGESGRGYRLVAARYRGILIPLVSVQANDLAEAVVLPLLFPRAKTIQREVTLGRSRLDFLLLQPGDPKKGGRRSGGCASAQLAGGELFLEVKACTLVEEGTAMFPDAPTPRGLRHLEELGALTAEGRAAGILFILMNPQARRFVPNLHTDPDFARKLISLKGRIWMRAVSIRTSEEGTAGVANPDVPIDLAAADAVSEDRGAYLLIVRLRRDWRLKAGSLGEIPLESGWYVYAGSGKRNLSARIARHHRKRKKLHWHIDFLLDRVNAGDITSLPVRSRHDLECALAGEVAALADGSTPGFGCSDCSCSSHLFRFATDPLTDRRFLDLLLHYRHTVALAS
jgi:sugar fermentation stimulation protein A